MVHGNALNSYQKAQVYDEMNPLKLIHMLYEGAIKRIVLSKEGIKNGDPKQRGENLGKAIAIISELNACLDADVKTEEIEFLRSFYKAMLLELPKVSVTQDVAILDRAEKYLKELKRIWETTVMANPEQKEKSPIKQTKMNDPGTYMKTARTYDHKSGSIAV